jgi:hypothetical protein
MDTKDILIDLEKFDCDRICYYKPPNFLSPNDELAVYYEGDKYEQKIICQSSIMTVKQGAKMYGKKYYLQCYLSSLVHLQNDRNTKLFSTLIKKIDRINEEIVSENASKWKLKKTLNYRYSLFKLENYPDYIRFELPHDMVNEFHFETYDEDRKKIGVENIKSGDLIVAIVELSHLQFGDKDFSSVWMIRQIRRIKPISPSQTMFRGKCFINLPQDREIKEVIDTRPQMSRSLYIPPPQPQPYQPPPPPPPPTNGGNKNNNNEPVGMKFVPNKKDLQKALKNLKKAEIIKKKDSDDESDEDEIS